MATTLTLWRAAIDTAHFSFEAYGATAIEASATLAWAWARHCQQTDADPDLLTADLADLTPYPVRAGDAFRDGSLMEDS